MVRFLLESGANVQAEGARGETALHIAAAKGFTEIVSLLIQYKSNGKLFHKTYKIKS